MSLKKLAIELFKSVLKSVDPSQFMPNIIHWSEIDRLLVIDGHSFRLNDHQKIYAIGSGKASVSMAKSLESILGDRLESGFIIAPPNSVANLKKIKMEIGSHPIPDQSSIDATNGLISYLKKIPDDSIVINLLSGGTSSLLCSPSEGISVNDLQAVYQLLIESGASIQEINTVRKTLSKVKGGQLLQYLTGKRLIDLVISDIPNDDLKYIGSGPTVAQKISFTDAISVSKKYQILKKYPSTVQKHLNNGLAGEDRGHLNNSTSDIENHDTYVVSSANKVANRAKELLEKRGFNTTLIEPAWEGLIDDFEKKIMKQIESLPAKANQKKALLFYGECTIQIQGNGLGGRNQELALRMSKHLKKFDQDQREIVFLSAGTDGIDGPTDVAGAVVDQKTYQNAVDIGLDPVDFIQNNDSYHFFKKIGGHIMTGPTGNNVMDLQIVLIGE